MTLKEKRIESGYTQSELSEKTGISLRSLQHMERNYRLPDKAQLETLCKLAIALDCPIDEFIVNDDLRKLYCKAKTL